MRNLAQHPASWRPVWMLAVLLALAGCALPPTGDTASDNPDTPAAESSGRSAESRALARYYARIERQQRARGLLRADGGGPDTPWTSRQFLRNFEQIVFFDEYTPGGGYRSTRAGPVPLRKWRQPVRMEVIFGDTVPAERRRSDLRMISDYAARLARVTGHPIGMARGRDANYHVLIMGEDDRDQSVAALRRLVPNVDPSAARLFQKMPRSIHCLVLAFSNRRNGYSYGRAVALIRDEHPPLLRRACVHEELAQGLGLANDSPLARPSIFNDDDEFALLTDHDEALLRLLYDPALKPGMTIEDARPILRRLVARNNDAGAGS